MKFRDAVKFSLELFLPERAVLAVENLTLKRRSDGTNSASHKRPEPGIDETDSSTNAQQIIEDLDSNQFGGPSFGPQTITLMSLALEEILTVLPQPVDRNYARTIAAAILKVAAGGERDPVRLRVSAMSALKLELAHAVETSPARPPD